MNTQLAPIEKERRLSVGERALKEEADRISAEKRELAQKTEKLTPNAKRKDFLPITMKRDTLRAFQYLKKLQAIEKWMSEVLKSEIPHTTDGSQSEEFTQFIRDGVVLCNLVNKIKPGLVKRVNQDIDFSKKTHHFRAMENIWFFLEATVKLGVNPKNDAFMPTDLFESKNISKVIDCLVALGTIASQKFQGLPKFNLNAAMEFDSNRFSRIEIEMVSDKLEEDKEDEQELESPVTSPPISPPISPQPTHTGQNQGVPPPTSPVVPEQQPSVPQKTPSRITPKEEEQATKKENPHADPPQNKQTPPEPKLTESEAMKEQPKVQLKLSQSDIAVSIAEEPEKPKGDLARKGSKKQLNYAELAKMRKNNKAKKKWDANEIMQGLYLGDQGSAENKEELQKHNITHILSMLEGKPIHDDFKYLIINAYDSSDHDMISYFPKTNQFITEGRSKGGVLVHCQKGVSRSATVVIAYMMANLGYHFYDAADYVCEKRPVICPNLGFIKQLQLYEQMNFQFEGKTEAHLQYKRLSIRSLLIDERTRWEENINGYSNPAGDQFLGSNSSVSHFVCKKCRHKLISKDLEIDHEQGESWDDEEVECDSIFTLPQSWMGNLKESSGDISCPNCKSVVGKWSWGTFECKCGTSSKPYFALFTGHVEL